MQVVRWLLLIEPKERSPRPRVENARQDRAALLKRKNLDHMGGAQADCLDEGSFYLRCHVRRGTPSCSHRMGKAHRPLHRHSHRQRREELRRRAEPGHVLLREHLLAAAYLPAPLQREVQRVGVPGQPYRPRCSRRVAGCDHT